MCQYLLLVQSVYYGAQEHKIHVQNRNHGLHMAPFARRASE